MDWQRISCGRAPGVLSSNGARQPHCRTVAQLIGNPSTDGRHGGVRHGLLWHRFQVDRAASLAPWALLPVWLCLLAALVSICPAGIASPAAPASLPAAVTARQLDDIQEQLEKGAVSESTVSQLQSLLKQNPGNARAHLLLGRCLERIGYEHLALESYRRSAALAPDLAEAHVYLCAFYFSLGRKAEALAAADTGRRALRGNAAGLLRLGLVLEGRGYRERAEELFLEAARDAARAPGVGAALARLHNSRGQYVEALGAAALDLKRYPNHPAANLEKGRALIMLGRTKEAAGPLKQAFDSDPLETGVADLLSQALQQEGRTVDAFRVALFEIASAASGPPERLVRAKERVILLMKKLPRQQARQLVLEVEGLLDRTPRGAFFHFAMGDVYDLVKEPYFARQEYRAGLALRPDFARGLFRLGQDEEIWFHNYELALELYERAARLDPTDAEIHSRLQRLRRRAPAYRNDLAGHLRDWLWSLWLTTFKGPGRQGEF
ncbi:MAG TPA: hypothetical protein V6D08_08885 [Candidatus Obscuribacterales bacterium]